MVVKSTLVCDSIPAVARANVSLSVLTSHDALQLEVTLPNELLYTHFYYKDSVAFLEEIFPH